MTKTEQLEEMLAVCRNLGAEVEYHPEYSHFTAMVWEGWALGGLGLALRREEGPLYSGSDLSKDRSIPKAGVLSF